MRIFLAGASGVLGSRLIPLLRERGHEVTGLTRSEGGAARIRARGAQPVRGDALDAERLRALVVDARPDVVLNELTSLPRHLNLRRVHRDLEATNRLRRSATRTLREAAGAAGATRLISQSVAFAYDPVGDGLATEEDPLYLDPPAPFAEMVGAVEALERTTLAPSGPEGVVLRYGYLYGPGTSYAKDGEFAEGVRRRRVPIVGDGAGVFSFVHVEDAARATVTALEGPVGTFNVVDDDPAPYAEWLSRYAQLLGAPPPRRVPRFLGRLAGGRYGVYLATMQRGASNRKAKGALRWAPTFPSWRDGFRAEFRD